MLSHADNEILTQTGAGTPMGEYFRRYWLPVALSREMPAPDSPPIRVKVMGEELVAFRDTNGRVGLIEPSCAHRGTRVVGATGKVPVQRIGCWSRGICVHGDVSAVSRGGGERVPVIHAGDRGGERLHARARGTQIA